MTNPTPPVSAHGISVYLDDGPAPIANYTPPAVVQLDTTTLNDGPHTLRIEAVAEDGARAIREIRFVVRNGPGIAVSGLEPGQTVSGVRDIIINAYAGGHVEAWEPISAETPAPIPTWAWVVAVCVLAWGMWYLARELFPPPQFASTPTFAGWTTAALGGRATTTRTAVTAAAPATNHGAELFRVTCANCHQANGEGVPGAFPPLANDPVVTGDAAAHAQIVLFGLSGKTINGVKYTAQMPAWGNQLSDDEVVAIMNYERSTWGNNAPPITPQQVAAVRAAHTQ
jgi:mono/diheme cytochrome c family protein